MSEEKIEVNAENVKFALRILTEFDWVSIFNDLYKNRERIDKAIEYIERRINILGQVSMLEEDILSILKGEDKE